MAPFPLSLHTLVAFGEKILISGFLSWEKTFVNCLKIDFSGENFREFTVTQCTIPTNVVSNCLKIDFR